MTVAGEANGWTEFGFNTYGTGTGKTIKNGGPSTKALQDPAFRNAVGYAIDKDLMLQKIHLGYGVVGTTPVPPVLTDWHTDPNDIRTFDLAVADQKLTEAGYVKDASGNRLDKQGKVISLKLVFPQDDDTYAKAAEFIAGWFKDIGIKVTPTAMESGALVNAMLPPEADGTADYDLFIWGWSGSPDPSVAAGGLHLQRHRRIVRQPVVRQALRRACTPSRTPRAALSARPPSMSSSSTGTTRRRTTSSTTTPTCTPTGPTSSPTGRTSRRRARRSSPPAP